MSACAPLLQSVPHSHHARRHVNIVLVYRAWAEHYNTCVDCQRDEWYSPLEGEPFFCAKGKGLFRSWVAAAHITPP